MQTALNEQTTYHQLNAIVNYTDILCACVREFVLGSELFVNLFVLS